MTKISTVPVQHRCPTFNIGDCSFLAVFIAAFALKPLIFSNVARSDFYVHHSFIEDKVIAEHAKTGRDITAKRWEKSSHVCHLKKHKAEYEETIHQFLHDKYFSQIQKEKIWMLEQVLLRHLFPTWVFQHYRCKTNAAMWLKQILAFPLKPASACSLLHIIFDRNF